MKIMYKCIKMKLYYFFFFLFLFFKKKLVSHMFGLCIVKEAMFIILIGL